MVLGEGHPEGVLVEEVEALEDELRGRGARGAFADLVAEAEGFGHGEQAQDAEEGGAFVEGFGDYAAPASRYDGVDASENFG